MAFDRNDSANLAALKSEVLTDPIGMGYAPVVENTSQLLKLLNDPANNVGGETVDEELTAEILLDVIDTSELGSNQVDAGELEWLKMVFHYALQGYDIEKYRAKITGIFQQNSATNQAIDALQRSLSRAEVLFGPGTVLGREDWFAARDS